MFRRFFGINSYIYWTDWGRNPKIERARLDGTERKTLVNNGIQFPNGLALDESDKKLYWAGTDANKHGIIEAISLDGLNRTIIFYRHGYHPFSLDIFKGYVYWSDWGKNAVLRINKSDGGGEEVIVADLNKPMGLKILHRCKEKKGSNIFTVEKHETFAWLFICCCFFSYFYPSPPPPPPPPQIKRFFFKKGLYDICL